MTSRSSAADTGHPTGKIRTASSRKITVRRMELSFRRPVASPLENRDPITTDHRTQPDDGPDDDGQNDGAQRAGHARIAVLDLGQDRDRSEVEAGIDEEDHRAHRDHPVD